MDPEDFPTDVKERILAFLGPQRCVRFGLAFKAFPPMAKDWDEEEEYTSEMLNVSYESLKAFLFIIHKTVNHVLLGGR